MTNVRQKALIAAFLGWGLDGMDVMLYAFALPQIQKEFMLSGEQAGLLASVTLFAAAFGGSISGWIADRYGRTKALMGSILLYSIFTGMMATANSFGEMMLWRALVGLGLGAEWSAGTVLISEIWPAEHRGKAMGFTQSGWAFGYMAAALLAGQILPDYGWRPLFVVGVLPALLVFWIRRNVPEPEVWLQRHQTKSSQTNATSKATRTGVWRNLALAIPLSSFVLFAYWGVFSWLPGFLAAPIDQGGAGLSLLKSTSWLIPVQVGAIAGYWSFGLLADRVGRRPAFAFFTAGAAVMAPLYGIYVRDTNMLLIGGALLGFFGHGYYGAFGAILSELFPTGVRGLAQGVAYNGGRLFSALAPTTVGWIAQRQGFVPALLLTGLFFGLAAAWVWLLPETKGRQLEN
jgi:MFS family permease